MGYEFFQWFLIFLFELDDFLGFFRTLYREYVFMKIPLEFYKAAEAIKQSDFLLITAGAGMGVDSGLPDFRSPQGFWRAYPPISRLGLSFPETSNPQWFYRDPSFIWAFFGHRYNLYTTTVPHTGFSILKSWCSSKDYFIFTSNVDGQFQKSGFPESHIVECHGSIHYLQCTEPHLCTLSIWPMSEIHVDLSVFKAKDPLPKCINCGKLARPNILMFGDYGWIPDRTESQKERLDLSINRKKWKICVVEIGAGDSVYTVRAFGEHYVYREKASFIRINPDSDFNESQGIHLKIGALEGLSILNKVMGEIS